MEWKEGEGRGNTGKVAPKYNRSGLVGGHKALFFFYIFTADTMHLS